MTTERTSEEKAQILKNIEIQKGELSKVADLAQSVLVLQDHLHKTIAGYKRRLKASGGATILETKEILGLADHLFNFAEVVHQSSCVGMALFHREHQLFQTKMAAIERLLVDKKKIFTREEVEKTLEELQEEAKERGEAIQEVKADADFDAAVADLKGKA